MFLSIIDYFNETVGHLLNHTAKVYVEDWNGDSKYDLVYEVAAKCGFHELGYGIMDYTAIPSGNYNEYIVKWSSGTHCD